MKRTVLRSSAGKKLYATRNPEGQFEDIQTYERAHGSDVKRVSAAETAGKKKAAKKAAKKTSKKVTKKKTAAKKKSTRR